MRRRPVKVSFMPFFTVSGVHPNCLRELLRPAQLGLPTHGLTAFLGVEDDVGVRVHHLELDDRAGDVGHVLRVAVCVAMMCQSRTREIEKADDSDDCEQQTSYHGQASPE